MCPRERLVLISISTGLSFAKKGLGHLLHLFVTFVTCSLFCCLVRKPLKICLLSIHRDFLLYTTVQHLLLLVGIDTPIYRKYYDTPPVLVAHQSLYLDGDDEDDGLDYDLGVRCRVFWAGPGPQWCQLCQQHRAHDFEGPKKIYMHT